MCTYTCHSLCFLPATRRRYLCPCFVHVGLSCLPGSYLFRLSGSLPASVTFVALVCRSMCGVSWQVLLPCLPKEPFLSPLGLLCDVLLVCHCMRATCSHDLTTCLCRIGVCVCTYRYVYMYVSFLVFPACLPAALFVRMFHACETQLPAEELFVLPSGGLPACFTFIVLVCHGICCPQSALGGCWFHL